MEAAILPTTTKIHCNACGRSTNHEIIATDRSEGTYADDGDQWYKSYEMLKCRGCDGVAIRHSEQISKYFKPTVNYYPPAIARRAPEWLGDDYFLFSKEQVPDNVVALMREIYVAIQNNSRRLVAMGIRATLESIMINKVGDQGSFTENLDALVKAGYVSSNQRGNIDVILGAGHAAMHRGWEPTEAEDIDTLLDITESLVEDVYLHTHRANRPEGRVPKRPRRNRTTE